MHTVVYFTLSSNTSFKMIYRLHLISHLSSVCYAPLQFHRNRLSKFEYHEGDPDATRASEEVLLQSTERPRFFHNGGWLGFKPSDYSIEVSFSNLRWLIAN